MKNLTNLFNECKQELDNVGIQYGEITNISVNTRAKSFWGICRYNKKTNASKIEISSSILQDNISDVATKNTIIHEILHTCENCQNHSTEWQRLANIVNKKYGYNVKRTTTSEEKGISAEEKMKDYKYCVSCEKCGRKWYRMKKSNLVMYPQNYRCDCGGTLKVENL